MQEQIKQQVEDYLSGRLPKGGNSAFDAMLETNPSDRRMLEEFAGQAQMIRDALRVPAELAPAPGFYARVMARVEAENAQPSFWSIFTDPFGQRLVYASAALLLLMGVAIFTTEQPGAMPEFAETPAQMLVDHHPEVHLVGDQSEDRGRVFVTLTSGEYQ